MKKEYKRELNQNYMILEEESEQSCESFELHMLENNTIPGFLSVNVRRTDNRMKVAYEITSRQPLDLILDRKQLDRHDLIYLLTGLRDALNGAREYLLDTNHLILSCEYIYQNLDDHTLKFCYFPYYDREIQTQFFELSEYILGKLDKQDRCGVEIGYEIYRMASEDNCSIDEILNFARTKISGHETPSGRIYLYEESSSASRNVADTHRSFRGESNASSDRYSSSPYGSDSYSSSYSSSAQSGSYSSSQKGKEKREKKPREKKPKEKKAPFWRRNKKDDACKMTEETKFAEGSFSSNASPYGSSQSFGGGYASGFDSGNYGTNNSGSYSGENYGSSYRGNYGSGGFDMADNSAGTQLLSEGHGALMLYPADGKSSSICVDSTPFYIGKKKDQVDGCIKGHNSVSRLHARIDIRSDGYYLMDLNSTNGTFLDEQRLEVNQSYHVIPGSVIRFGDATYRTGM